MMIVSMLRKSACLVGILSLIAISADAQENAKKNASSTLVTRLITLGTGAGPRITPYRSEPANVILVRGTPYLFDAGNGVLRQLALANVPIEKLHTIFLTHLHDDHTADVGTVFGMQWSVPGSRPKIDVYGPPGTTEIVSGFLQFFKRNADIRISDSDAPDEMRSKLYPDPKTLFTGHDIQADGPVYQDDNIKVFAVENQHFHFRPGAPSYGRDKSYAYRVETPDRVIIFTGDTGPSPAVTKLAKGADILVSEVISLSIMEHEFLPSVMPNKDAIKSLLFHMANEHLAPEEVGKMAAEAGVKMVVLSHIAPGRAEDPDTSYIDGVKKYYQGDVVLAKDLMAF